MALKNPIIEAHFRFSIKNFALTGLFCVVIAMLTTGIGLQASFLQNLVVSLCVGFSIHLLIDTQFLLLKEQTLTFQLAGVFAAIAVGGWIGVQLGFALTGLNEIIPQPSLEKTAYASFVTAVFFGIIISYFFYSRAKFADAQSEINKEKLVRMNREKQLTETQLRLLQAQIEPHFLFNTLAAIQALIDVEPQTAQTMLEHLNAYLRTTLVRTRHQRQGTLGEELQLLKNYLSIMKIRFAGRLEYHFEVSSELHSYPLSPMLLQPLVENSLKHGLEAKPEGGWVHIIAKEEKDFLLLKVLDNGLGMDAMMGEGTGLSNVRHRLQSLYGSKASLEVRENLPEGTRIILKLPAFEDIKP